MDYIGKQFNLDFQAVADPQAVVQGPNVRFTVLTPYLIRLEYSATNQFEDRPTLTFWHRHLPVPAYDVEKDDRTIKIHTDALHLHDGLANQSDQPSVHSADVLRLSGT